MKTDEIIANYNTIFTQMHKQFKWTNKTALMAAAAMYIMKSKPFDPETFNRTAATIKHQAGWFSSMKSHPRFTTAAILDVNFEVPVQHVPHIFTIYDDLIQQFKRGNFTYFAATIILTNDRGIERKELISKAKKIYGDMKKEHPFLTGQSDYPLATILAYENRDDVRERMEHFYDKLNDNQFNKGNNLQFLSHILSIDHNENDNELINRVIQIYDEFKRVGLKQKSSHYPVMGMLALLSSDEVNMETVASIYKELQQLKHFKWQKDICVMLAGSFFVSEKLDHANVAETSIYTAVESIIQAQQAVMIGAMAGGVAASSSSSGGS